MAAEIESNDAMPVFEMRERRRPVRYIAGERVCEQNRETRSMTVDVK
jgi:hypothetical protein